MTRSEVRKRVLALRALKSSSKSARPVRSPIAWEGGIFLPLSAVLRGVPFNL